MVRSMRLFTRAVSPTGVPRQLLPIGGNCWWSPLRMNWVSVKVSRFSAAQSSQSICDNSSTKSTSQELVPLIMCFLTQWSAVTPPARLLALCVFEMIDTRFPCALKSSTSPMA